MDWIDPHIQSIQSINITERGDGFARRLRISDLKLALAILILSVDNNKRAIR